MKEQKINKKKVDIFKTKSRELTIIQKKKNSARQSGPEAQPNTHSLTGSRKTKKPEKAKAKEGKKGKSLK